MSKNLALTLARAKNSGIKEGIDAVCETMALAHYNAAIELELDEREVGAFYTRMRQELLGNDGAFCEMENRTPGRCMKCQMNFLTAEVPEMGNCS